MRALGIVDTESDGADGRTVDHGEGAGEAVGFAVEHQIDVALVEAGDFLQSRWREVSANPSARNV